MYYMPKKLLYLTYNLIVSMMSKNKSENGSKRRQKNLQTKNCDKNTETTTAYSHTELFHKAFDEIC